MTIYAQIANSVVVNVSPFAETAPNGWISLAGMNPQPGMGWTYANNTFTPPSATIPLADLAAELIILASTACSTVTSQIVPSQTYAQAYLNAATIVWANDGAPPASGQAQTAFAQLAASVGISDAATFAKVVTAVSLGSMQLSTILGTLQAAARSAQSPNDLATALSGFQTALNGFVASLNNVGLTVTVAAPPAIVIPGINA